MLKTFGQWHVFALVVLAGAVVSSLIQRLFMEILLDPRKIGAEALDRVGKTGSDRKEWESKNFGVGLQRWLGFMEIILFASAVVFQHAEFIAVWFATKYIAVWRNWGEDPAARTFLNRSLFGSGLNILLGFATGGVAQWAIGRVG